MIDQSCVLGILVLLQYFPNYPLTTSRGLIISRRIFCIPVSTVAIVPATNRRDLTPQGFERNFFRVLRYF